MKTVIIEGFVIKSIDYKESSKIVTLFTKFGKINIRALGSKKYKSQNFNFHEILQKVSVELTDEDFPCLVKYDVIDSYKSLKEDIRAFSYIGVLIEFLNSLPLDIPYERTYNFFDKCLNIANKNYKFALALFMIKTLPLFGIKPELKKCVICQNTPSFISIKKGGAVCDKHKEDNTFNLNDILKIYEYDLNNIEIFDLNYDLALDFVFSYYMYHADLRLKNISMLII